MVTSNTFLVDGQTYTDVYFLKVDASGHSTIVASNPSDIVSRFFDHFESSVFAAVDDTKKLGGRAVDGNARQRRELNRERTGTAIPSWHARAGNVADRRHLVVAVQRAGDHFAHVRHRWKIHGPSPLRSGQRVCGQPTRYRPSNQVRQAPDPDLEEPVRPQADAYGSALPAQAPCWRSSLAVALQARGR